MSMNLRARPRVLAPLAGLALVASACEDAPVGALIKVLSASSCEDVRCGASGVCAVEEDGGASCSCALGYTGAACDRCDTDFHRDAADRCVTDRRCADQPSDPCAPHGTCTESDGVLTCVCSDGFDGPRCNLCGGGLVNVGGGVCAPRPDGGPNIYLPSEGGLLYDEVPGLDAGTPPAGSDAGGQDAAVPADSAVDAGNDAGQDSGIDAGIDASAPDAGPVDSGAPDAGTRDASLPDASVPDASVPDAAVCATDTVLVNFDGFPGWPDLDNTCEGRRSFDTAAASLVSSRSGFVQLCARSSFTTFSSRYVVLEASSSSPAELRFSPPATSLSFAYSASLEAFGVDLVVDGKTLRGLDAAASTGGTVQLTFTAPTSTLSLRARGPYIQRVGIDDLTVTHCR